MKTDKPYVLASNAESKQVTFYEGEKLNSTK